MQVRLIPHPDTPRVAVSFLTVEIEALAGSRMRLGYRLEGRMAALAIPEGALAKRTDELWKHTCFEAFVRKADGNGYAEFNFSPSTQWAAYSFSGYRAGMTNLDAAPAIHVQRDADSFSLDVVLEIPRVDRLGLSAVIEAKNGEKSYWAVAHAAGRPDFHHPDSFAIDLGSS